MSFSKKLHQFVPLGFILSLSLFLRLPSLYEPNHYGDEGIYQAIGQVMHRGLLLYRDAWDNKPPLLYAVYALFDGNQFWVRLSSLIFGLLAIAVFYFLAKEVFPKRHKIVIAVTLLFAVLFSLPLLEGNIANSENFMLLPIILAFYLVFKLFPNIKASFLFSSGLLLSLAFLFKIVAVFDLGALLMFLIIGLWGKIKDQLKIIIIIGSGFVFPIFVTAIIFLAQGVFKEFLSAAFSQNVGYVAQGNKLFIAQGWLLLKLFLLSLFCLFLFLKRRSLSKSELLIFLWMGFSVFNALFAERPWIHYLLVLIPAFCLLTGLIFEKTKFRILALIFTIFIFYIIGTRFWIYGKTFGYYLNFFSFVGGAKTVTEYRSFWGKHVNRDYQVAQFLDAKTGPDDPVFIWGNDAQIYALAKRLPASRYTVAYHMGFTPQAEKETLDSLLKTKPKYFIILLPKSDLPDRIQTLLSVNYSTFFSEEGFLIYARSH